MRDGPLYTFLDVEVQLQKPGELGPSRSQLRAKKQKVVNNPFESMPTYQRKYAKPRRRLPKLDERQFGMFSQRTSYSSFLIKPLVSKWFPEELQLTINPAIKPSRPTQAQQKKQITLNAEDEELEAEAEEEEEYIEQEQDDDFEDDELEGDDYNAEQYFDNGEDDVPDDEEGGGGGDYE
jgi:DNA-directed RNA polymerase III subunit RPC7